MDLSTVGTQRYEGFEIFGWHDDAAVSSHILYGVYEPEVTAIFRRYVRPGMYMVDIGANVGYFTMLAASLVGSHGLVDAIEANPKNARMVEASRRLNGFQHVRIANVAVGSQMGLLSLQTDYSNGTTINLGDDVRAPLISETVPAFPLSSILVPGRKVDMIKIDIEGAEFLALSGSASMLRRDQPFIISEFTPWSLEVVSRIDPERYLSFLTGCGYHLGMILETGDAEPLGTDHLLIMRAFDASNSDHINIVAYRPGSLGVEVPEEPYSTDARFHERVIAAWHELANAGMRPGDPLFFQRIKEVGYTRGWPSKQI